MKLRGQSKEADFVNECFHQPQPDTQRAMSGPLIRLSVCVFTHSVKDSEDIGVAGDCGATCGGWRRPRTILSGITIQVHTEFLAENESHPHKQRGVAESYESRDGRLFTRLTSLNEFRLCLSRKTEFSWQCML